MINKDCEHYPCHNNLEDCSFCWCPAYPCAIPHLGTYTKDGDWDCSNCELIHKKDIVNKIKRKIRELINKELERRN